MFLFDEPLSNLDATLRGQTRIEIARLHKQFAKASVVYVTHDQIEAMTLADRIVLLHAGKDTERYGSIAQVGTPLELYHRPKSRFVAGFIGSPRMNFLPATVSALHPQHVQISLAHTGEALDVPDDAGTLTIGQAVTLGIRPEHLETHTVARATSATPAAQSIQRTVTLIEQLGEHSYLHLDQPGGDVLIAKAPGDIDVHTGERLTISAPAASCHLFNEDGSALAHRARASHHPINQVA